MNYLNPSQHYEDRYDLHTIELCLKRIELLKTVVSKVNESEVIDTLTDDEITNGINQLCNMQILSLKVARFEDRETTIAKWYEEDRVKQDMYDNTPEPKGILCDKCGKPMDCTMRDLQDFDNEELRILFFFTCKKCNCNEAVYENGEVWVHEKEKCRKCNTDIETNVKKEGDISTWTYACSSCDYKKVKVTNHKEWKVKQAKREKKDKSLLEQYRNEFCMSDEDGKSHLESFDELEFAQEVYKSELQKYKDPAYEKSHNLKKLTINELESLLNSDLGKYGYQYLTFERPILDKYVDVPFSIQQKNTSQSSRESINELKKKLKESLIKTNWRLKDNNLSYRLGILTGLLRGYERDEDILKVLGKKKEKKIRLDPEKESKYATSNAVGLAKFSAEFKAADRLRRKRLEKEPDGFYLEDGSGGDYSCNLCYSSIRGSKTWWTSEGIVCPNCHENIKSGVVPIEILRNNKIHLSKYKLEEEFKLRPPTIRKYVRTGELIARELKDENGQIYHRVFMVEDNLKFFKSHPEEGRRKWYYLDQKGKAVWV